MDTGEEINVKVESKVTSNEGLEKAVRILKIVNGGIECLLGFPILGGLIIVGLLWIPLVFMFASHIVALVLSSKAKKKVTAPILGVIANILGWIPIAGMILHIITAIFNLIEGVKEQ